MSSDFNFRVATFDDLERLSRLVNSAYRGESSRQGWTTEADLLDGQRTDARTLRDMIGREQVILLAENSVRELLGCVYLKRKSAEASYLGMLTVMPTRQSHGLGKRILAAAEKYAHEKWQATNMEMRVITVRHELISWYERRGYRQTTKMESFPYGDETFGIPKRPDLQFVVLEKSLVLAN